MAARIWAAGQQETGQHSTGQPCTGLPSTGRPYTGLPSTGQHSTGQHGSGQQATEYSLQPAPSTFVIPQWYAKGRTSAPWPCQGQGPEADDLWEAANLEDERAEAHQKPTSPEESRSPALSPGAAFPDNKAPGAVHPGHEAKQSWGRAEGPGGEAEELVDLQRKLLELERIRSTAADHCERFLDMLTTALATEPHPHPHPCGGDKGHQGRRGAAAAGESGKSGKGRQLDRFSWDTRQSPRARGGQGEGGEEKGRRREGQHRERLSSSGQSTACEGILSEAAVERRHRERQRRRRRASCCSLHPNAGTVLQQYGTVVEQYHLEECLRGASAPLWHTIETPHSSHTASMQGSLGPSAAREAAPGLRCTQGLPDMEIGEGGSLTAGLSRLDLAPQRRDAGTRAGAEIATAAASINAGAGDSVAASQQSLLMSHGGGMRTPVGPEFLAPQVYEPVPRGPEALQAAVPRGTSTGAESMRSRAEKEFLSARVNEVAAVPSAASGSMCNAAGADFLAPQVARAPRGPGLRKLPQHAWRPPQGTPQDVWAAEGGAGGEAYDLNKVPSRSSRREARMESRKARMQHEQHVAAQVLWDQGAGAGKQFASHRGGEQHTEQFLGGGGRMHEGPAAASFYYGSPLDSQQAQGHAQAQARGGAQDKGQAPEHRRASLDNAKDWTPGWRKTMVPWSVAQRKSLDLLRPRDEL